MLICLLFIFFLFWLFQLIYFCSAILGRKIFFLFSDLMTLLILITVTYIINVPNLFERNTKYVSLYVPMTLIKENFVFKIDSLNNYSLTPPLGVAGKCSYQRCGAACLLSASGPNWNGKEIPSLWTKVQFFSWIGASKLLQIFCLTCKMTPDHFFQELTSIATKVGMGIYTH